jgi:hypothetical protein
VSEALRVVAAAIRVDSGTIYSVPKPGRHHDVYRHMREQGEMGSGVGHRQGFILSDGSFVSRADALEIARRAGQLIREPTGPSTGLFSEDVW